jgi:hypothetical protein
VVAVVGAAPLPATPLPDLGRRQRSRLGVQKEEGREVGRRRGRCVGGEEKKIEKREAVGGWV